MPFGFLRRGSWVTASLFLGGVTFLSCSSPHPKVKSPQAGSANAPTAQGPATLVVQGGTILTMDPKNPRAEAVAVAGDRIIAVGRQADVAKHVDAKTKIVNLGSNVAIPGFIEGHAHFLSLGQSLMRLRLQEAKRFEDVVAMVETKAKALPKGQWIFGRGWHQSKWSTPPSPAVQGLPTHHKLSKVSPDHPVLLEHASGHAVMVNEKAMELANITDKTPDPPGGEIVRDKKGHAIGVFRENAAQLVRPKDQLRDPKVEAQKAKLAAKTCLSKGITSFQDAGTDLEDLKLFHELANNDELGVRLWVMLDPAVDNAQLAKHLPKVKYRDTVHHRFTVGGIKRYIDGALGSHGAWLLEPYEDLPSSVGLASAPLEDLRETARLAKKHGMQLCTHAIGDRGNREMLNIYRDVLGKDAKSSDHRWRIEHAQHLHPQDIASFADLGVIASVQPIHCISDGPWVASRLGAQRAKERSYRWQDLLRAGVVVSNGTDAPVEDVDALANYHAAVTRQLPNGEFFEPAQAMSREQALRAATLDAAYAAFEDGDKGSLEVGKLADIAILSQDITSVPAEQIRDTQVVMTILGGQVKYERQGAEHPRGSVIQVNKK